MRSEYLILAMASIALAGCAGGKDTAASPSATAANRTDPATLKVTGEPRRCIPNRSNGSTRPAGDSVLMFRQGSSTWFRNDLRGPCPSMRPDRALVFLRASSQYCELDTFQVVDAVSRMNFGTCVLGPFTPVEVPRGSNF